MVSLFFVPSLSMLALLTVLSALVYYLTTKNYRYWKKRGVPYEQPVPFFGNFFDVFTFRKHLAHYLAELYRKFDEPFFGIYILHQPVMVVKDPKLIKSIIIKDFNYFQNHVIASDDKCDSLASKMMFVSKTPDWKLIRTKMTPIFTTGKIKGMLPLITKASEDLNTYIEKNSYQDNLEIKEVCAKYATDVIASCAFGIEANSFLSDDAAFRSVGRKLFDMDFDTAMRQLCYFVAPAIVKLLRIKFIHQDVSKFLRNAFWHAITDRESGNFKRNDLIDIIVQIKKDESMKEKFKFEGDSVVAQATQFFLAGFETVSSTMAFTMYELSLNKTIHDRLKTEIRETIAEKGVTYESIQGMKYLHMVVSETLRKYPVLAFLDRMCNEDYKIPGSDVVIEKGIPIFMPLAGLHFDEKYFPDPQKYDPERFSEANKPNLAPFSYLPFGDGPRNCIGERFGLIASKLGLIRILSNFDAIRTDKTPVPLVYDTKTFLLVSTTGLPLKLQKSASVAA